MKQYIFGILLIISGFCSAQQWHHQNPLPSSEDYHCIFFTSADTGFIVGSGGIILKTSNSGNSWVNESGNTHNILYSVYFPTRYIGYAAGDSGTILKTTNGGSNWILLPSNITNNLKGIYFTNVSTGYAAGSSGAIFKTINGGLTWSPAVTGISQTINAIYFTTPNTGYAVSDNGKIIKTTDAGNNWSTITTTSGSLFSVYFPSINNGFAAGAGGHIAKTTDGGITWTFPASGTTKSLRGIFFINGSDGCIVGDQGTLLKTSNGGTTWIQQNGLGQEDLLTVRFTDPATGYSAGGKGKIVKSVNNGNSWVKKAPSGWHNGYFDGVYFTTADTGFTVGDSGLILKTTNGGTNWIPLVSGTLQRLSGIHFPSANIGYAVGKNGKILKTTNSGNSWVNQVSNCAQWLKAVYFSDNDHGCAVGGGGAILMTSDGGVTWTPMICLTIENEDVFFTSNLTGYIAVSNGYIIKTIDGGVNWTLIYQGGTEPLNSIHFPVASTGYAVGNNGEVLKTTNGGITWIRLPDLYPGTGYDLLSVHFLSADTGIVVGTSGILARTFDGGQSWITLNSGTDQSLSRFQFINLNKGWIVGTNGIIIHGPYLDRPGIPDGPESLCLNPPNSTYTTTAVTDATSYTWSITPSNAGNITGNVMNAMVDWNNSFTGLARISVQAQASNGEGISFSDSLLVSIDAAAGPAGSISGPDTVCAGSSGIIYSIPFIQRATGYHWTVPSGATIMAGQNTNSVTVSFSGSTGSGNVTVYGSNTCGNSNTSILLVLIPDPVGTAGPISGQPLVCSGTVNLTYSISPVMNATGYTWTIPGGWVLLNGQNTNSITVNAGINAITGTITVYAGNSCGNSNSSAINVIVNPIPAQPGSISGPDSVCPGSVNYSYSINSVQNSTGYTWSVPNGWQIISGQNTTQIITNTGPGGTYGNIEVFTVNSCGNSIPSILPVYVKPLPAGAGVISGPVLLCPGSANVLYSLAPVLNATGYLWTVPVGDSISSGQNTTSITVTTGFTPGTGSITVHGLNSCGSGQSSSLQVTIATLPVPEAGPDQSILFGTATSLNGSATGGSGNYQWQWEPDSLLINPNVQNPVTTPLTMTTVYTLTVTDLNTLCFNTDTTTVTVTGDPLSVDAYGTPNPVCIGSVTQLQAAPWGGSLNYSFLWSSDPPGFSSGDPHPLAYPTVNTTYYVEVSDGYNTAHDSVGIVVTAFPAVPDKPTGPDTVDIYYVSTSQYMSAGAADADYYQWELIPAEAGTITGSGTTGTVNWNSTGLGEVSIRLKGVNECGEGNWSDAKAVFLENTGTTGIQEPGRICDIVLFPNPAHERLWIRMIGKYSPVSLSLMNLFGEEIISKEIIEQNSFVDINALPGIYFVIIKSWEQKIMRKLIIQ